MENDKSKSCKSAKKAVAKDLLPENGECCSSAERCGTAGTQMRKVRQASQSGEKKGAACKASSRHCHHSESNSAHPCCSKHSSAHSCHRGGGHEHSCCSKDGSPHSCCSGNGKRTLISTPAKLWISAISLITGFFLSKAISNFQPLADPSWIAVILCGLPIFCAAREALCAGKIGAPALVSLAMIATISLQFAAFFGVGTAEGAHSNFIFAAGEIAFLMACGAALEERTLRKAASDVKRLSELTPRVAFVKLPDGKIRETPSDELKPGDIVVLKPHSMIPADGTITRGATEVDQSNLTGESLPVEKKVGDELFAATTNLSGVVEMSVTKSGIDSAAGKLSKLVEEAAGTRAPISRIANKWAARLVLAAFAASVAIFFIVKFGFGLSSMTALIRSATALTVFCPCAFVLATPTAISAAIGNLSRRGIVVKSGSALEEFSKVDAVIFDKTGTLTRGKISVSAAMPLDGDTVRLAGMAATAERFSEHPIAKAVASFAKSLGASPADAESTLSHPGVGVSCNSKFGKIQVAKASEFESEINSDKKLEKFAAQYCGKTIVAVSLDGRLAGLMALGDKLRENSAKTVSELKSLGCEVAMVTGDSEKSASVTAKLLGIENVVAAAMPETKFAEVLKLKNKKKSVCMVGDGVNDAPALAASDVSVAVGKVGNDIAVENADITLLSDDIYDVCRILKFSRSVLATIRANMALSLAVSATAICASAFGILNPVTGALLHNISSITVVGNSARLLRSKKGFS